MSIVLWERDFADIIKAANNLIFTQPKDHYLDGPDLNHMGFLKNEDTNQERNSPAGIEDIKFHIVERVTN